jgi:uncharacterized protein (TIGR02246 family)
MRTRIALFALALLLAPLALRPQSSNADDEKAIREIETQWEAAWNSHNAAALAKLAAPDADFVNARGGWGKGRDNLEKGQTDRQKTTEKDSIWKTNQVEVRFLTPDVAIVHVYWVLIGERNQDGVAAQPHLGIFTRTDVKRDGKWLIAASQATYVTNQSPASAK